MKKILFIIFIMTLSIVCAAQTETTYYSNQRFDDVVAREWAKYSETITTENGVTTITRKNLKKDLIISRTARKGDEPVGIWIIQTGSGLEERDYNFDLKYEQKDCSNAGALQQVSDFLQDNKDIQYTAPKLVTKEANVMEFIRKRLRYPAKARREGIQGTVDIVFTITKDGIIEDVVVTNGVHVVVDKEAASVIRMLKLSGPPLLNGAPQQMCVKMPIRFKLA